MKFKQFILLFLHFSFTFSDLPTISKREIKQTIIDIASKLFSDEYVDNASGTSQQQTDDIDEMAESPATEADTDQSAETQSSFNILQEKLAAKLTKAVQGPTEIHDTNTKQFFIKLIKQELTNFEASSKLGPILERLLNALKTIPPTSTESERVFSMSSNFCTKKRSRLSDTSLDSLCFLKSFFLNNEYQN